MRLRFLSSAERACRASSAVPFEPPEEEPTGESPPPAPFPLVLGRRCRGPRTLRRRALPPSRARCDGLPNHVGTAREWGLRFAVRFHCAAPATRLGVLVGSRPEARAGAGAGGGLPRVALTSCGLRDA